MQAQSKKESTHLARARRLLEWLEVFGCMPNPRCTTFCNNSSLVHCFQMFKSMNKKEIIITVIGFSKIQILKGIFYFSKFQPGVLSWMSFPWVDGSPNITSNKIFVQGSRQAKTCNFYFISWHPSRPSSGEVSRSCSGFLGMCQKTSAVLYKTHCFPYFTALF